MCRAAVFDTQKNKAGHDHVHIEVTVVVRIVVASRGLWLFARAVAAITTIPATDCRIVEPLDITSPITEPRLVSDVAFAGR